ncbi:MAG: NAD-dependent epimerase/dehydratase family protein [Methylacidiphilales bacterium]|nr:NAD-dependent epimerase/dehydratase family protein [Candidatus Methylacidiphilales bacterium]
MGKKILILGGNGFLGRSLAIKISKLHYDYTIFATSRKSVWNSDLKILPNVTLLTFPSYNANTLKQLLQEVDIVINCIGILNQTKKALFRDVHSGIVRMLVEQINTLQLPRIIHISAHHADANAAASRYLRSKGESEMYLHTYCNEYTNCTTFKPSLLYGFGDSSISTFASIVRLSPYFYPVISPHSIIAPIYINDFTSLIIDSFEDYSTYGKIIDVLGPEDLSLLQIHQLIERQYLLFLGKRRSAITIPRWISYLIGFLSELTHNTTLSVDMLRSLEHSPDRSVKNLKTTSTKLEHMLPTLLGLITQMGEYSQFRKLG